MASLPASFEVRLVLPEVVASMKSRLWLSGCWLMVCGFAPLVASAADYLQDIKPLLKQRCTSCHGAVQQSGDLRLDAGALVPSDLHAELLERITTQDEDERMPPEGAPLSTAQVTLLREWIAAHAPYPSDEVIPLKPSEHWAFQPSNAPVVPASPHAHPLDAWLFGNGPADPPADPAKVLRRVYLDLLDFRRRSRSKSVSRSGGMVHDSEIRATKWRR